MEKQKGWSPLWPTSGSLNDRQGGWTRLSFSLLFYIVWMWVSATVPRHREGLASAWALMRGQSVSKSSTVTWTVWDEHNFVCSSVDPNHLYHISSSSNLICFVLQSLLCFPISKPKHNLSEKKINLKAATILKRGLFQTKNIRWYLTHWFINPYLERNWCQNHCILKAPANIKHY